MVRARRCLERCQQIIPTLSNLGVLYATNTDNQATEIGLEQIALSLRWINSHFNQTGVIPICSYGVKQCVEKWSGKYVSNGAFIAAAVGSGNLYILGRKPDPNVYFEYRLVSSTPITSIPSVPHHQHWSYGCISMKPATPDDLQLIRNELATEETKTGVSFLCNWGMIVFGAKANDLFMIYKTEEKEKLLVGMILFNDVENGNFSPNILNIWPRYRRHGIGTMVVHFIEKKLMRGKTMAIDLVGDGIPFWTSLGYTTVHHNDSDHHRIKPIPY